MNDQTESLRQISCADDYDPNSMPVAKAREVIGRFLSPVTTSERVHIRAALGRVLAEDVISPLDVPAHDNSAMDGYAVRFADLKSDGKVTLKMAGTAFAGVPFKGAGESRRMRAHHDRRRGAAGRRHHRHAGACRGQRRCGHDRRRPPPGPEPAARRRGPENRAGRAEARPGRARGGNRAHRLARHSAKSRSIAACASRSSRPATN